MATTSITAGYDVTVFALYIERCTFLPSCTFSSRTDGDGESERRPRLPRQVLRGLHLRRIRRISPLLLPRRLQVPERRRPLALRPVPAGGFQLHSHPLHLFIDSGRSSTFLGSIPCCLCRDRGWSIVVTWDMADHFYETYIFHIGSCFMIDPHVFMDERL